ncbi:hypothetical protein ANO14919_140710 [Xylariales sp. No.14919]|nr:hypothetical protein ANO14919_140710 [Xylariales sp. No.14919]
MLSRAQQTARIPGAFVDRVAAGLALEGFRESRALLFRL